MLKKLRLGRVGIGLTLMALAATAVLLYPRAVQAEPVKQTAWPTEVTGAWTGCYVGAEVSANVTSADLGPLSISATGYRVGGALGCDMDMSGFVVGARGRVSTQDADIAGSDLGKLAFALEARAGIPISPTALLYVFGGYTQSKNNDLADFAGWTLGAGAALKLTRHLALELEGGYTFYQNENIDGVEVEPSDLGATARLTYRF